MDIRSRRMGRCSGVYTEIGVAKSSQFLAKMSEGDRELLLSLTVKMPQRRK